MAQQVTQTAKISAGQSLVEFVLVMPIMVLILIGAFSFGMGTYQAHMTSDAMQFSMLNTTKMANEPGSVSGGMIQGYINAGGLKGSFGSGSMVDGVSLRNERFIVAKKNFTPAANFIPGFTISVAQALNPSLLKPTSEGGGQTRPLATAWVPGGTMNPPPWTPGGAPAAPAP